MKIIVGDSWACGEWASRSARVSSGGLLYKDLNHRGIVQYLREENSNDFVVPLGLAGSSNFASAKRLEFFLDAYQHTFEELPADTTILFFTTEWIRDFLIIPDCDIVQDNKKNYLIPNFNNDFISIHLSKTCYLLSHIAQTYKCKIGLVGGTSDTMWLDNFSQEYPGLYIACQSWTSLLIHDTDKIDVPVFSVTLDPNLYIKAKQQNNVQLMAYIEQQNDLANLRLDQWDDNQEWFYPDGSHPNRDAHKKLYKFLKQKNII